MTNDNDETAAGPNTITGSADYVAFDVGRVERLERVLAIWIKRDGRTVWFPPEEQAELQKFVNEVEGQVVYIWGAPG